LLEQGGVCPRLEYLFARGIDDTRKDEVAAFGGGGGFVSGHDFSFRVFALGLLRVVGVLQASNVNLAHHEQGIVKLSHN
jgi:hypothetical protein